MTVTVAPAADLLREARARGMAPPGWVDDLSAQQQAALDAIGNRCVLAPRRAGKTYLATAALLQTAIREQGSVSLYLSLTQRQAREILWLALLEASRRWQVGGVANHSRLALRVGRSEIRLAGADSPQHVERLRGNAYARVVVDEAASFRSRALGYLIREILSPALLDYAGDLWLIGTPGAACTGPFHDATTGGGAESPAWPTYRWTIRDNPRFARRADAILEEVRRQHGWVDSSPAYRREYLGEWVRDASQLVYPWDDSRMVERAPGTGQHVVAVDLGASATAETTAIVVLEYERGGDVTIVSARRYAGMTPSTLGQRLATLSEQYDPHALVVDAGGLGGGYVEELRTRFRLPAQPARKRDKRGYIELMADDLRAGRVRCVRGACDDLLDEWRELPWDDDHEGPDPRWQDHCSDAALYGWRECRQWREADKPKAKAPFDPWAGCEPVDDSSPTRARRRV